MIGDLVTLRMGSVLVIKDFMELIVNLRNVKMNVMAGGIVIRRKELVIVKKDMRGMIV